MLVKEITYEDYNGETQTEKFYFNLNKLELTEMEFSHKEGFENFVKRIIKEEDNKALIELLKELILKTYGEKSSDGKRFIKSPELSLAFSQTAAFSELFMELASNSESTTAFVNGIVPKNLV
jgi:hypothetical protein